MPSDQRRTLTVFLTDHAARFRSETLPDGECGVQLGLLARGGTAVAYLATDAARAMTGQTLYIIDGGYHVID